MKYKPQYELIRKSKTDDLGFTEVPFSRRQPYTNLKALVKQVHDLNHDSSDYVYDIFRLPEDKLICNKGE